MQIRQERNSTQFYAIPTQLLVLKNHVTYWNCYGFMRS